jgi:cell division GTPase FtsZ
LFVITTAYDFPDRHHLTNARGFLGILRGEQDLSAEAYHNASEVLHPHTFPGDWPFIMGLVYDDSMGRQAEVTVLIIEARQSGIY